MKTRIAMGVVAVAGACLAVHAFPEAWPIAKPLILFCVGVAVAVFCAYAALSPADRLPWEPEV